MKKAIEKIRRFAKDHPEETKLVTGIAGVCLSLAIGYAIGCRNLNKHIKNCGVQGYNNGVIQTTMAVENTLTGQGLPKEEVQKFISNLHVPSYDIKVTSY